jgi:peptidoglycan/LPS O-acetylase OafA/YrhL
MGSGKETKQTFETLNGMRGIAALAVVMMHAQWWLGVIHPAIVSLAVDFFFVLSGFVIAYAYQEPLRAGLRRRDFMLARFIRLYPMFVVGLVFGIAARWIYARPSNLNPFFDNVGFNLVMLPFPLQYPAKVDNLFPLNFPAWSLFYELIAYMIFALLTPRLNNRRLAVLIAIGFLMLIVTGVTEGSLDRGTWRPSVLGGFARVTFSFFAGVARLFSSFC